MNMITIERQIGFTASYDGSYGEHEFSVYIGGYDFSDYVQWHDTPSDMALENEATIIEKAHDAFRKEGHMWA